MTSKVAGQSAEWITLANLSYDEITEMVLAVDGDADPHTCWAPASAFPRFASLHRRIGRSKTKAGKLKALVTSEGARYAMLPLYVIKPRRFLASCQFR